MENSSTLYSIKNMSTLYLVLHLDEGMQIFVKTLKAKTLTLEAKVTDTIETLKGRIQIHDKNGTPPDKQILFFAGQQLEDSHTLFVCSIQNKSSVASPWWNANICENPNQKDHHA